MGENMDLAIIGVYQILNTVNGKQYIGSTSEKSFTRRWNVHFYQLRHGTHDNHHLQYAWNKYGEDVFKFSVLEIVDNPEEVLSREQHYLDNYIRWGIDYNISPTAGSPRGYRHSKEAKAKISAANKGKSKPESFKEKLSLRQKGKPRPKEVIEKMRLANLGRKLSDEHRAKISAIVKGRSLSNAKQYNLNGESKTLKEWAKYLGIKKATLQTRIHLGWSIEDVLSKPRREKNTLIIFNEESRTLKDWAVVLGVQYSVLINRISHGWSIEEALSSNKKHEEDMFTYNNETKTLHEWATILGIKDHTLWERIHVKSWSIERALTQKHPEYSPCNPRKYVFDGQSRTLKEWSVVLGIKCSILKSRIRFGWSIEDVLSKEKQEADTIAFNNETRTISQWSEYLGIKRSTLYYRIQKGYSIEEIFSKQATNAITFNNETMTLPQWAEHLGIKYVTLHHRIRNGWSIEKAFSEKVGV